MSKPRLAILAALAGWAFFAPATAVVRVSAGVQPGGTVAETDPVQLVVRVEGAALNDVTAPHLPPLKNLRIVNGPSTSSQFAWVNGQASASAALTWVLLPEGPGTAEVPPIQVRVGTTTYRTEPIRLQVGKGQTGPRTGGAPGSRAQPLERRDPNPGPDVFLRAELGSPEAWVGEPVVLTVTLYATTDIANASWREQPSFSNFWVEDVNVDPAAERYRTNVGGRAYVAYPLAKKILMANAPGDLTIEPYAAQLQVRRSNRDVFTDFFSYGSMVEIVRKSEPLTLRVKRLPEAGRPADFGGAVGTFRLRSSIDRKETNVNDAVALKVIVEGEGLLRGVAAPRIEAPPDVKVFDPKTTESNATNAGKVVARKTWEWVLVPLTPGNLRLPPPSFSYFDPAAGAYRQLSGDPIEVAVLRGGREAERGIARGEIHPTREDIAFIKPLRGTLASETVRFHRSPYFALLLALPALWVPAVILVGRRQARRRQDRGFARAGRARARARKRLRGAERKLGALDSASFHEAVARALVEYVADRFDRSPAGLTYEVADELLESKGVDAGSRARFRACLERCDFARFVPEAQGEERKADVLGEATGIVEELEKRL